MSKDWNLIREPEENRNRTVWTCVHCGEHTIPAYLPDDERKHSHEFCPRCHLCVFFADGYTAKGAAEQVVWAWVAAS